MAETAGIPQPNPLPRFLVAGAATGLLGVLLFGLVHAFTLVPIWDRLAGGIPFCILCGIAIGWLRYEMYINGNIRYGTIEGLRFGFLLWMSLIPMTLLGLILRKTGMHNTESSGEVVLESFLAFSSGIIFGYCTGKRVRYILAFGISTLILALTQAGPVALLNNNSSAWFFIALGIVYMTSGSVLVCAERLAGAITAKKDPD